MLERIRNNLGLKLLSVAIALAGWTYLRLTPNPVIAAHFLQQVDVPISTTGLRSEEIARFTEKTAVVAVDLGRGGSIKANMVRAVLDLDGRGPGIYNVPLQVIAPKLDIRSLSPASVTLAIERVERRSVPIVVRYVGDGRRVVVTGRPTVEPAVATVSGATSDLARVASVRVDVALPGGASTFDAMVSPALTDVRGDAGEIAVTPNLVHVRVRFSSPERPNRPSRVRPPTVRK